MDAERLILSDIRRHKSLETSAVRSVLVGYAAMAALTTLGDPLMDPFVGPSTRFPYPIVQVAQFCVPFAIGFASGAVAAKVARSAPLATGFVFAASYFGLWLLVAAPSVARQPIGYWASLCSILPGAFVTAAIANPAARRHRMRR